LRDGDRERVGDHEAADEESDAAKTKQELLEEGNERIRVLAVLLCLPLTGAHLRVGREDAPDLLQQVIGGNVRVRCDRNLVELAGLAEKLLCRRQIEAGKRCTADGRDRAELHDSG